MSAFVNLAVAKADQIIKLLTEIRDELKKQNRQVDLVAHPPPDPFAEIPEERDWKAQR